MIEKILESVNIGNIIKQKLIASLMPINKFADRLGCDRSVVDNIFNNESIDIDRLVRISEILDFDFIHIYYWKDTATGSDMHVIKEMIDSVGHIHKTIRIRCLYCINLILTNDRKSIFLLVATCIFLSGKRTA